MLNKQHSLGRLNEDTLIDNAASLVELLQLRADRQAHRTAYTFLENGEQPTKSMTYGELDLQARQLAMQLQALGLQGERAILLYPLELDYIVAFFACLYGGLIAVPAYPPSNGRHMPRLQAIIDDSQAAVILSTQSVANAVRQFAVDSAGLLDKNWLITDNLVAVDASAWRSPTLHDHDPAFLQYTSGSTGNAKGVIINHGNLMANQQLIKRRFGHNAHSTVVGWLPLYHDMGLIGNVMQPLYCGASAILMSPMAFLEKPVRWLQAINDYRAHTSGGPNFAFELCARKITAEEKAGLDLGSWRLAFNGAEPINPDTMERFSAAFSECGFSRKAFYPCYGLAEATLLATGGDKNAEPTVAAFYKAGLEHGKVHPAINGDDEIRQLVGCGGIDVDAAQRIRIVDPESGELCRHDQIGEIQLGGPSISPGYWQNSAATQQAFVGDANGKNRWLRTGDLGFIEGGELFVSGRLKDLIIIRGRNYYPHDLEYAIEAATDALNPGCAAAFAVSGDDGEKLVVLAELKRNRLRQPDYRTEFVAIRTRLVEECGIQADTVMLLKPGAILKTSSGKIRRSACRQAFEQQQLKAVAVDIRDGENLCSNDSAAKPATSPERTLTRQALLSVADVEGAYLLAQTLAGKVAALSGLTVDTIDIAQSLPSLDLDSLKAVELKYFIDELLAIDLPVVQLLGNHSLAVCAEQALKLAKVIQVQIAPVAATEDYEQPLSFGQQALWTVNRIEKDSPLYNMPVAMHIRAKLDKTALHGALAALFERHAQLRSGFRLNRQTRTVRIPLAEVQPRHRLVSVTCYDERQRREAIAAFVRKPLDLEKGPLLRAALFSCADDDHVLVFCAHHIVVDFRSLSTLLEEFKALYLGHDLDLPEPAASYADYVAWQSAYLIDQRAEQDWQYWQRQLSGELPKLVLPIESQMSCLPSCRGRAETLNIAPDTLQKLKRLAAEQHTTLYTLLLTVFKTLLYRYSGQQDIIVGSPTLGRPKRQFADTVGYFVNPVALRSHPAAEQRFSDYLAEVNTTVLDALAHQHYPFSLLVEKLQPEREQGASAFYQSWFVLQSGGASGAAELALGIPGIALDWAGLSAESYALDDVAVQFDMTLLMAETKQGLAASFQYRSDLLSRTTVLRFIAHFQCLLHGILANPIGRLSELPLLTVPERKQLTAWNATGVDYPCSNTIHGLFEAVVLQQPQAIALVYQERHISYAELNAQANRLAHSLRSQGAGPEKRVALCMLRCPELVVGILAILKAGAVYVLIDPAYPQERLAYLMQDAGCEWLLTGAALLPSLGCADTATLCVDDVDAYADYSSDNLEIPLQADHAAYVIYTSGSTGKPKGVVVSHGNLMHSTRARNTYYQEPVGCYLLLSSFAFDSSVAGIFWTLSQGGCLCLPEDDQIKDPAALGALIERRRVTHLLALPSFYELLLEHVPTVALKTLKTVVVAGEACTNPLTELHFKRLPDAALFNEYGPTEATVWSSVYAITQPQGEHAVPIGKPIGNMHIYVVDDALHKLPVGVAGELLVGGAGISRGYLDQSGLTAERFIPDPFGAVGGRLYKTGDRVRYLADGNIEFLGRLDQQVKIRGYRIELGEIEACLLRHSSIKAAAVLVREDVPGNKRLTAYLVGESGNTTDTDALKAHIKRCLPEYMLPSAWLWLDAMPLNANGKLDRNALPASATQTDNAASYVAPRDEAEQAVADIWREVLGVQQLSIHDDFFELGGHSLSGVQVTAKVQELFNIEVPVNILFEAATVAKFVDRMAEYQAIEPLEVVQ
ncbi:amino acid adenylation domain-containing protein [Methylobacter sp. G7]|uniref:amino acid adenylation domain-containing protein n=1 Tax=Methylobacter sp. G7 TaxID=3230117 RepID=UPI003D805086